MTNTYVQPITSEEQRLASFSQFAIRWTPEYLKHMESVCEQVDPDRDEAQHRIANVWKARFRDYNRLYGRMHQ